MFAIELFLDSDVEKYVSRVWKQLHDHNISSFMFNIKDIRPHISLAVYREIDDLERFKHQFMKHFNDSRKINIKFDSVGIFPTSGTCFLAPVVTDQLLKLHDDFHTEFAGYRHYSNPNYLPGSWNPHCTLATKVSDEEITKTIGHCLKDFKPLKSAITGAGIVEITFEGDQCISSPTIYSETFL